MLYRLSYEALPKAGHVRVQFKPIIYTCYIPYLSYFRIVKILYKHVKLILLKSSECLTFAKLDYNSIPQIIRWPHIYRKKFISQAPLTQKYVM